MLISRERIRGFHTKLYVCELLARLGEKKKKNHKKSLKKNKKNIYILFEYTDPIVQSTVLRSIIVSAEHSAKNVNFFPLSSPEDKIMLPISKETIPAWVFDWCYRTSCHKT